MCDERHGLATCVHLSMRVTIQSSIDIVSLVVHRWHTWSCLVYLVIHIDSALNHIYYIVVVSFVQTHFAVVPIPLEIILPFI